jgi:hypothetical protein
MLNIDEIAPVPLFVKLPRQRRGRGPGTYVRTVDVAPTIADVLGWRLPYRADGRSAFSRAVKRRRSVLMIKREFTGRLRISAGELARRRAALLRLRLRRFGSGSWDRLYTGIGPNRALIGRAVAELAVAPGGSGGLKATIAGARDMRSVDPRSLVLPTQVAGPIAGGEASTTRDVAVAVNGRIEAVGRSFHLHVEADEADRAGESFAVMVPERSMRPGRNRVEVFEVVGGTSLRLLGTS